MFPLSVLPPGSDLKRSRWEEGPAACISGWAGAAADPQWDEKEDVIADGQQLDPPAFSRHFHQQGEGPATYAQVQ